MQILSINNYQNNQISHRSKLKSLNNLNPISIYADKYFNRMAKLSDNIRPIIPELIGKINPTKYKNISGWDINPNKSQNYIIFLHGMAQNVSDYQGLYKKVIEKNTGIFITEFRGYGENKKTIVTEDKLRKDVETTYEYLTKKKNIKPQNIIVMGHSMGGALASHFASKHKDIKSLILLSPIVSMPNLGTKFSLNKNLGLGIPQSIKNFTDHCKPLKWLYNLRFNSINPMKKIETPTYIIHSKNDSITTLEGVRKLAKTARKNGILEDFVLFSSGGHRVDNRKINSVTEILDKIL